MAKRVLVVDNYDSFVYILVQYLGQLGVEPLVLRNDEEDLLSACWDAGNDGILISPGPGSPKDAGKSVEIVELFSGKLPILGVCLGHQCIAAAFGGEIVRDNEVFHGKTSEITHGGGGIFEGIEDHFTATRYHSLVVSPNPFPQELDIAATTDDGVIMAVEHVSHPTYGIQFHPESVLTTEGMKLLANFCEKLL